MLVASLTAIPGCSYLLDERAQLQQAISRLAQLKQEANALALTNSQLTASFEATEVEIRTKLKEAELSLTKANDEANRIKALAQIEVEQAINDAAEIESQAKRDAATIKNQAEEEKQ
ncbi:MAG: hypothetical protein F6K47_37255, partial [Symploca sp. SIO2E6]|nr:hypothetical protein [Symploca sp. SIO2E6]